MQLCNLRFMTPVVEPGEARAVKWQNNYWKEDSGPRSSVPDGKFNQVT
jgi:hypothetical protein